MTNDYQRGCIPWKARFPLGFHQLLTLAHSIGYCCECLSMLGLVNQATTLSGGMTDLRHESHLGSALEYFVPTHLSLLHTVK